MNIPGFTAEHSTYRAIGYFRLKAARSVGGGTNDNQVYLQAPNKDNTPGGKCHASTTAGSGGTINQGTYDSEGHCCGPKLANGSKYCINCDGALSSCNDGDKPKSVISGTFLFNNLLRAIFVRPYGGSTVMVDWR